MTGQGSAPCPTSPSRCMNDLCRGADVGICGNEEPISDECPPGCEYPCCSPWFEDDDDD